ncbi:MgtC/SapB family protein [Mucilaginibacter limnophilus]|uniref:MgtC/SapB family protein n=1 Tax=Mucilaginibacter limnophilus TaxID=1932778 RepID=A0A437MS99_9SPHI|nr:MgtC/SapB family protein [Mucilaginibacter limnophilus]RVU00535.1 MgtC/SapB family protein [Mucilaginibacter limnophilus]
MDFSIEFRDIISIIVSVICGGAIGFEREFKNKSTGFRTIILITLGSTIFTIVSRFGAGTDDRISANIITGIGFIGAGVIFKDKLNVLGLTTAAVIWTSAGIGMTAGIGYYSLAVVFTVITLFVLILVNKAEETIVSLQKSKVLKISFAGYDITQLTKLEEAIKQFKMKSKRVQIYKENNGLCAVLMVSGTQRNADKLVEHMVQMKEISEFH